MKCIHCGTDSTYKERAERKCKQCAHPFAFEPKSGAPFTDPAFHKALQRVSGDGQVRWTLEHLHHELARTKQSPDPRRVLLVLWGLGGTTALLMLFFCVGAVSDWIGMVLFGGMIVLNLVACVMVGRRWLRQPRLMPKGWDTAALYEQWVGAHGKMPGLIEQKRSDRALSKVPDELLEYSFDRAVICDRPETVDLLVANNFHFENNCAILSINGHPKGIFSTVRKMLKNNPRLTVFALHDATLQGCLLAHRLAHDPEWFTGMKVVDVGLRPAHARHFEGLIQTFNVEEVQARPGLTEAEAAWLSNYTLALAAVRPEQLIKRLYRAITEVESGRWASDGGSSTVGVYYLGTDTDVTDGGGDSFG